MAIICSVRAGQRELEVQGAPDLGVAPVPDVPDFVIAEGLVFGGCVMS